MKHHFYMALACACAVCIGGCSGQPTKAVGISSDIENRIEDESTPSGNSELDGVQVTFTARRLEYGMDLVDPLQYIYCDRKDVQIDTEDTIDLQKVGDQTVTYELRLGNDVRKETHTFVVQDTKGPIIQVERNEIELSVGDVYDVKDNIIAVRDPVEGNLPYLERKPSQEGQGWYTIFGAYSTETEGIYDLTVEAFDCNGNEAEEEIRIIVK